jgi:hypothetical protein
MSSRYRCTACNGKHASSLHREKGNEKEKGEKRLKEKTSCTSK